MKVLGLPTTKGGARKTKADKLRELQMYAEANEAVCTLESTSHVLFQILTEACANASLYADFNSAWLPGPSFVAVWI